MTLSALIAVLTAFFKFPDALSSLVKLLSSTPVEQHQALIASIQAEAANMAKTGRPTY
jgi:hypothetical protein